MRSSGPRAVTSPAEATRRRSGLRSQAAPEIRPCPGDMPVLHLTFSSLPGPSPCIVNFHAGRQEKHGAWTRAGAAAMLQAVPLSLPRARPAGRGFGASSRYLRDRVSACVRWSRRLKPRHRTHCVFFPTDRMQSTEPPSQSRAPGHLQGVTFV